LVDICVDEPTSGLADEAVRLRVNDEECDEECDEVCASRSRGSVNENGNEKG